MIINHNIAGLNTLNKMNVNQTNAQSSLAKLSSGMRINKAGDDAAGLVISEKMRAQVRGLDQASANAQDGVSMIQTAEGGLNEVHSILQRMRELADQSANGTNTSDDRVAIQSEVSQLKSEIDRIGNTTEFNTQKLLNGNLQSAGATGGEGTNTTLGAVVARLTSAKITSGSTLNQDLSGVKTELKDTLSIDGQAVEVNWDTILTQTEKDAISSIAATTKQETLNSVAETIVNGLNKAIDNYNTASGKSVQHVIGYLDAASNKMVLESASKGANSNLKLTGTNANSIAGMTLAAAAGTDESANGSALYNGITIPQNSTMMFTINGVELKASIPAGTSIIAGVTTMESAAVYIKSYMNRAISTYNSATGAAPGQQGFIALAKVTADASGRLSIQDETGTVTFRDRAGSSMAQNLGLTVAQTSSSGNGGMTFQIGANKDQTINFGISDMRTAALGISGIDVSNAASSQTALTSLDSAIKTVSMQRASLGAVQNRLEHTVNNLRVSSENATAAESRIRDVDMAKEMMSFSKNNILNQAAQAMMAQANQLPQGVLQLLR